jgi:hypothetical protein
MATNRYFTRGTPTEQRLYEDIIIESLKIYGQDVYYLPREIVKRDTIFNDDNVSRFDDAYRIEMYIENIEGFDGEGDLFTKFGVEIRDAATFIVARRRWAGAIQFYRNTEDNPFYRPREGDLIFLTLSDSFFEITKVETESPFYQLKDLPVFKIRAELFEYNDEDFDTGLSLDNIESNHAYQRLLTFDLAQTTGKFEIGDTLTQVNPNGFIMTGDVVKIDASVSTEYKVWVAHAGADDGKYHTFSTQYRIENESGIGGIPLSESEGDLQQGNQNDAFDTESSNLIDFSESNPFGDPI